MQTWRGGGEQNVVFEGSLKVMHICLHQITLSTKGIQQHKWSQFFKKKSTESLDKEISDYLELNCNVTGCSHMCQYPITVALPQK